MHGVRCEVCGTMVKGCQEKERDFKACQETGVARERPVQRNWSARQQCHGKSMSSARAYKQRCQEKGMARKEM